MKKIAAATMALVTLAGLSGAAASSSTAAPERAAFTKHYVLKEIASRNLERNSFAGSDRIKSRGTGNVVGFDSFTGVFDRQTRTGKIWIGIALRGGVINGRVTASQENEFAGKITGGTGRYQGIDGTITGRSASRNRTFVALHHTL